MTTSRHHTVHGLHSRIIGRVTLDDQRLAADIATMSGFEFNAGYSDYARGNPGWRNCVLANETGDPADQVFGGHNGDAVPTPLLEQLPYVSELLAATFDPDHLVWARIFMCENGMLIPHRDYLDLPEDEFTRVHIPLQIGDASLHSELDTVFRMRRGEVWFIDGTVNHAAYSYDGRPRIYLSCDFRSGVPFEQLFRDEATAVSDVPDIVELPELPADFDATIAALAPLLRSDTIDELLGVLSTVHFRHAAPCGAVYDWLNRAALESGDDELVAAARAKQSFFLGV